MHKSICFDYSYIYNFIKENELIEFEEKALIAQKKLIDKTGMGKEYTGWVDLPVNINQKIINEINQTALEIQKNSDCLVVIGIGGSYLGSRAVIEMLCHNFYSQIPNGKKNYPDVYYAGNNMNPEYLADLIDIIKNKNVSLNVISKSGGTMEIQSSFKILKDMMEKKYGKEESKGRIFVTTGSTGILKEIASEEGYKVFDIPDDVGGRFSVLTSVGLLPIAIAGGNINEILKGAQSAYYKYNKNEYNDSLIYAVIRYLLNKKGKNVEIFSVFDPRLSFFTEWLKQLFAESEGKNSKGILPMSLTMSTDLHSLGQYIQEGQRIMFETFIYIKKTRRELEINEGVSDFLVGKKFSFINNAIYESTKKAHNDGGVPIMTIEIPEKNEYYIGQLIYFFEKVCGVSGYLLGVNPFNQQGVETYKKNTLSLLKM